MGRIVKCKICSNKIDSDIAYKVSKENSKGKVTNSYYCSEDEYNKDKEEKGLWLDVLRQVDIILEYTCISKTKVNMIKEIEEVYSRKQLYNCLVNNSAEIKRYLDEKNIFDEYGKLSYIFACVKNKIKDENACVDTTTILNSDHMIDMLKYEDEEDVFCRLEKQRKNARKSTMGILELIDKNNKGGKL